MKYNLHQRQNQSQIIIRWRAPRPYGASPTQPYKCSQNVKVKIKINVFISASAKTAERGGVVFVGANCVRPPLTLKY